MRKEAVGLAAVAMLLLASTGGHTQSALPQFSDPYGGVAGYVQSDPAPPAKPSKAEKKSAARKPVVKSGRGTPDKIAPADTDAALAQPKPSAPHPATLAPPKASAANDSPLGVGLKWSAANNPGYGATSTVTNIDMIKRNQNDSPLENGNTIQAGVNLKF